jgi:hypothetical protein
MTEREKGHRKGAMYQGQRIKYCPDCRRRLAFVKQPDASWKWMCWDCLFVFDDKGSRTSAGEWLKSRHP